MSEYACVIAGGQQGEEAVEGGAEAALRGALQEQEQLLLVERARVAALDTQVGQASLAEFAQNTLQGFTVLYPPFSFEPSGRESTIRCI